MGAWGSGLYANDCTLDVRDTYMGFLRDQHGNAEAYEKTMEKLHEYIGDEDEPLLWFALADTQWKTGRLMPEVKEKALGWIAKKGGIEYWEDSELSGAGWLKTLQKLEDRLGSPMPKERKIRKPEALNGDLWELNDIYTYQFHEDVSKESGHWGKYMLLQKIEGTKGGGGFCPTMRVHVFDRVFDEMPTLGDMDGLRILPLSFPSGALATEGPYHGILSMHSQMRIWKKMKEYPSAYLTFVGNKPGPPNNVSFKYSKDFSWTGLEDVIEPRFLEWRGKRYEMIGDGVHKYFGDE